MSYRGRRRGGRRLPDEKIRNLRATPRSIRLAPEFTHIPLGRRHVLTIIAAGLILVATIGAYKLHKAYANYAAIVDERLDQRTSGHRAGLYAAPRRVSVGQQISQDELRERLLLAGYREGRLGASADQFTSGFFVIEGDTARLWTNEFARAAGAPESVKIKFNRKSGGNIVKIEDAATDEDLKSVALPPESLTAESSATTFPRAGGIQASFEDFPPSLVNALIAIEDRSFFSHRGVDMKAVFRALWENWRHGEIREGGSTITQQLVKTNFLTPERTYQRKFAEAMMAVAIERRLSKEEIFTTYANRVFLGQSGITAVYGFKQAARVYFGKELHELSLAESALLAGLAQAPNRYSPYLHLDAAVARRNTVIDAMAETQLISPEEAEAAKSEKLKVVPPGKFDESSAQYFVDYLRRELAGRNISEGEASNLEIRTTLDPDLQQAANVAVKNYLSKLDRVFSRRARRAGGGRPEAALIAIDPHTGEILAMVGGRDYASSQLNRVTDARRQPGSVFKPIVYAAALANGVSPDSVFIDSPHEIIFGNQIYRPQNYGGRFSNQPVTLREGVVRSLNVVAVEAAIQIGLSKVADIAEKMGLPRPEPYPSMALGAFGATPFEIARVYSTFANGGVSVNPFGIKSITLGGVTEEIAASKTPVLQPSAAYVVTETLAEAVNRGTGTRVRGLGYNGPAAGKTGSSHDAWFAGYTPKLLAVVWVGFDDYHNLGMVGGDAAAPIWTDFIKRALALRPDLRAETFTPPAGAERMEIDTQPDQNRLARQKRDSASAGVTRRRSVRRTRPPTYPTPAGGEMFRPLTNQYQLAPQLMPQIIRRQVQPMIRRPVQPMIRPVQPMIRR
jgi:penicillin-binding protein 1B